MTPAEAEHSARLEALIRARIADRGGWIDFETFMDLALYAPGLGYYSAGSAKLGRAGDFVTAPEVSDLFSRCVARQCAELLGALAGGEVLEIGAGTGRMAAVILESLAELGALPQRYAILEVSADLAERQRARLARLRPQLRDRVVWLDRLPERPMRGIILANEVLDALPCRRFTLADGALRELGVGLEDHSLIERSAPASEALRSAWATVAGELSFTLPDGYSSELCPRVAPWVAALGERLEHGLMLLLDYGLPRAHYYHPQRTRGTLRCHFKQRAHDDPCINLGVQDITAWVDFTAVAEAAIACGLEVSGFTTQAAFLLAMGIEELIAGAASPVEHARLAGEARRLLLPGEMGEAFKVMALTRDRGSGSSGFGSSGFGSRGFGLRGFALRDLRDSL